MKSEVFSPVELGETWSDVHIVAWADHTLYDDFLYSAVCVFVMGMYLLTKYVAWRQYEILNINRYQSPGSDRLICIPKGSFLPNSISHLGSCQVCRWDEDLGSHLSTFEWVNILFSLGNMVHVRWHQSKGCETGGWTAWSSGSQDENEMNVSLREER